MGRSKSSDQAPVQPLRIGHLDNDTLEFDHPLATGLYFRSRGELWFTSRTARNEQESEGITFKTWEYARAYIRLTRGV